jgi:hypothetical protein
MPPRTRRARGDRGSAEPVERVALRGGGPQPQLLGLAVHDDEVVGQVGQHAGRRGAAADARAAAPLGGEGAGDVQLAAPSS